MVAALLLLTQAPTYGLPADPALDRPLAIEVRIEPLPELLTRIGKALGVPLSVERRMEGLKATVFTPVRPARLTLAGLASVFDAEWTRVRGGYRLAETVPARNRREAYLRLESDLKRQKAEAVLTGPLQRPEYPPTGDAKKDAELEDVITNGLNHVTPAHDLVRAAYRRVDEGTKLRFWKGELFHLIGRTEGKPDTRRETRNGGVLVSESPPGPTLLLARYRPDDWGVRIAYFEPNGAVKSQSGANFFGMDSLLQDTAFRQAQRAWATDPATEGIAELLTPLKDVEPEPPRWAKGLAIDDHLRLLYRRSGLPIVAESNRRFTGESLETKGFTVREYLKVGGRSVNFRVEAGTLLHRPSEFWRSRQMEPEELMMAPFEAHRVPSRDAAAVLYASIPRGLMRSLREHVAKHDIDRFESGAEALRLWGRLKPTLRNRLLGGEEIGLTALPPEARAAVNEAIVESMFGAVNEVQAPISYGQPDPGASVKRRIALLGLGPGGPFTLSVQASTAERPPLPPGAWVTGGPPNRQGMAIQILDPQGNGLRFFVPD